MTKAFTYTNRMEVTYSLCKITTKGGTTRYVFSRVVKGEPVGTIPDGYEVCENVHGQVSLRRITPRQIFDSEQLVVQRTLERNVHLKDCRVEIKNKHITVFKPCRPIDICLDVFEACLIPAPGVREQMAEALKMIVQYEPVMRFALVDKRRRRFQVARMCYRGSVDGWLPLGTENTLEKHARMYLPHIGKDSFYALF